MSGFTIPDTVAPIAETRSEPNRTDRAAPAAGIEAVLVTAPNNSTVFVRTLRVVNTHVSAADTYTIYRIASGGTTTAADALAANVPIIAGEANFHENIAVEAGEEIVVKSVGGNVTFSADYGELAA